MANRFKQAAPKAKKLYRSGRYKTFADAMKVALKKTSRRKRKIGATKLIEKDEKRSTPAKSVLRINRSKTGTFKGMTKLSGASVGSLKSEIKKRLVTKIDKAVVRKYHAAGKREKKKIQKQINAAKAELRKLF